MNAVTDTDTDTLPSVRSDALARATALASRAKDLRRAQVEVQDLTAREVQVMARTAASFFDAMPLPEFTASLLPTSARLLRRMRHRILHHTVHTTSTGTMIRAMLLGRDGVLRLFSARITDSRDLLLSFEPKRGLPPTVIREVAEWAPTLRVAGFRPFEILERLSGSLDAVEQKIADAEVKIQVQKQALASGDLKALLPGRAEHRPHLQSATTAWDGDAVSAGEPVTSPSSNAVDVFDVVEAVAITAASHDPAAPPAESSPFAVDDEPGEWGEPGEPAQPVVAPGGASL
jgi:DNA-binding CsgD family transcriptional regulator